MKKILTVILVLLMAVSVWAGSQQVSSTLASTIITRARYLLNEATASFWSDAELLVYLNDGTVDIVNKTHCMESTASINLASGTVEYTITPDYTTVTAVQYVDADSVVRSLKPGNPSEVGRTSESFIDASDVHPEYWYDWAGKLGVYPALETRTTETVTVYYVERPSAVAAGANITTPALYDKALVLYVAAKACEKDKKYGAAAQFKSEYEAELSWMRGSKVEQPVSGNAD